MIRALCPTFGWSRPLLWGLCFQRLRPGRGGPAQRLRHRHAPGAATPWGPGHRRAPIPEAEGAVKVKVLLDDGRVKTLVVDAQLEILDTRGARR